MPDVLPLVLLGLILGPLLGLVEPAAFGQVGTVFSTIALILILFEGGLRLSIPSLKEALAPGVRLTVAGFTVTAVVVAAIARLRGWTVLEGLIAGAILGGTSSAVVVPMIERLPVSDKTRTTLILESAFSDVLCIVVTLALIQAFQSAEVRLGAMLGKIAASFVLASIIGAAGALFWSLILQSVRLLGNNLFTTPAFVCVIYGAAEFLGYSGAISALAFGIALGNIEYLSTVKLPLGRHFQPVIVSESEKLIFSELVFLVKTFFFVFIGVSFQLSDRWQAIFCLGTTVGIYAARAPTVRAVLQTANRFEAMITAAMAPKGLAAAVLASLPLQASMPRGLAIQDLAYGVILFSITATTVLIFLIEKRLSGAALNMGDRSGALGDLKKA